MSRVAALLPRPGELELGEMAERLAEALATSVADETEMAWLESSTRTVSAGRERPGEEPGVGDGAWRSVLVRVREGRRRGFFHTGSADPGELAAGIRQALAVSRSVAPSPDPVPAAEAAGGPRAAAPPPLWDEEVAELGTAFGREILAPLVAKTETARLEWNLTRVAVATSAGVARQDRATAVSLRIRSGLDGSGGAGAGRAAASARFLGELELQAIVERARRRAPSGAPGAAPDRAGPLLFSQEATCALVELFAEATLSSRAFEAAGSPLAGMLGEHVLSPSVDLVDDGLDPAGLPFPFDLFGRPKRRIAMIEGGVPRTPAVAEELSARLRLPPTPHAIGPQEARATHLFLLPHGSEAEVLAAAEGGVWIGSLHGLECFDPGRVAARGRARGACRVRAGVLGEPLPELVWEDSLLRLFSQVRALGGAPVRLASRHLLGGTSAPMVVVEGAETLRPAR